MASNSMDPNKSSDNSLKIENILTYLLLYFTTDHLK